ncbi:hypothetical protein JCM10908_002028 [Rhodotorula pacifica]|uniref:uncharacterized protein n=1 Tax=Rhodotorula pacifica TaxID=1495444 RepID=UPI003170D4CE
MSRPTAARLPPPLPIAAPSATPAAASTTRNTSRRPNAPRYAAGQPLDHTDSYILRGEDSIHHPESQPPSRSHSPGPGSTPSSEGQSSTGTGGADEEEERTIAADPNGDLETGLRERKPAAAAATGEKGAADAGGRLGRTKSSRSGRMGEQEPPETRKWANDIVTFNSKDDPANPKNWSFRRRYALVALLGITTMCSTFASSIFSSATPAVAQIYGISTEVATLGTSLFLCGFILGPVIFGPLSEVYGRKTIFIGTFVFICFSAGTATAKDLQTIMITRFFSEVGASAAPSVVGGALADMFDARERATAVVFYSLAIVAGPTVAPLIGAAVTNSYLGWRWTEYLVVILTSFVGSISVIVVPETFAPVILTRKAKDLRFRTKRWALHSKHEENDFSLKHFLEKTVTRPISLLFGEPMCTAICVYNSFTYGILYLMFSAVPIIFEEGHGWTPVQGGLVFLAVLVGTLIAALLNYLYSRFVFAATIDKIGYAPPELRLRPMMLGGICFPIGFFLLGWAPVPGKVVGLGFIGVSFLLIFQAGINYLIDAYTQYSASAVAANTFLRSIFAAALPLVAQPLYHNLGVGFACTLLGCVAAVLATVPFILYKVGPKLRSMSSYAKGDE